MLGFARLKEKLTKNIQPLLRIRGRPRQSWRRTRMLELDEQGTTWAAAKKIAQNRTRWEVTVNGLCSARNSED